MLRGMILRLGAACALAVATISLGCGASVSRTYESDVRFERCYALDWNRDVDPQIRHHCWEEWVTYFAVGQSRDRIEYAKAQMASISGSGLTIPSASASPSARAGASSAIGGPSGGPSVAGPLPEPTSVFAPVPVMASSASGSSSALALRSAAPIQRTACETQCDRSLEACLSGCASGVCERYCAEKHGRCSTACDKSAKSRKGS
ncbi:MAG: hypothetical protein U0271_42270 [Polyangiaceae bacterium]